MKIDIKDLELIANNLEGEYDFYRNKRIFLTGGTGFFGKWLLNAFIYLNEIKKLNIAVTILTRDPERFRNNFESLYYHENFTFVKGDVREIPITFQKFDFIIHAATDVSIGLASSNPEFTRLITIQGVKRICDFAKECGCKRILFTSSGAAYGSQPNGISYMTEDIVNISNFKSNDVYGSSKLEAEEYFKKHSPCDFVVARCFAFAGPYLPLNESFAFGNFINDALNQREINIVGDGLAVRSYLYSADLVIWLIKILSKGRAGEVYNVGSDFPVSILELAKKISHFGNSKVNVTNSVDNLPSTRNCYVPSIKKAEKELGLEVITSLEMAIERTLTFYRNK